MVRKANCALWGIGVMVLNAGLYAGAGEKQEAPSPRPLVSLHLTEASALQALQATTQALGIGFVASELPRETKPFELKGATQEVAAAALAEVYGCQVVDWGLLWVVGSPEEDEPLLTRLLDGLALVARLKSRQEINQRLRRLERLLREEVSALGKATFLPMSRLSAKAQRLVEEVVREYLLVSIEHFLQQMELYANFSEVSWQPSGGFVVFTPSFHLSLPSGRGELLSRKYGDEQGHLDFQRLWSQERAPLEVRNGHALLLEQRVSLELKALAALEVLRALSEQTDLQIRGNPQSQGWPRLSTAVQQVPLWMVLDALSLLSGRLWMPQTDSFSYTLAEPSTLFQRLYQAAPISFRACLLQSTRGNLMHMGGDLAYLSLPEALRLRLEGEERISRAELPRHVVKYLRHQVWELFLIPVCGACVGFDYPVRKLLQVEWKKEKVIALRLLVRASVETAPGVLGRPWRYGSNFFLPQNSWEIGLRGLKMEGGKLRGPQYPVPCLIYRDFSLRPRPREDSHEEGGET